MHVLELDSFKFLILDNVYKIAAVHTLSNAPILGIFKTNLKHTLP